MLIAKTVEETRLEVRSLVKYLLEEDPDPTFAEERIMVMLKHAYNTGRIDQRLNQGDRFHSVIQEDFRKIPL